VSHEKKIINKIPALLYIPNMSFPIIATISALIFPTWLEKTPHHPFSRHHFYLFKNQSNKSAMTEQAGVIRNLPTRSRHMNKPANSLSSAGTILCCSSIGSSDIRNCNSRFIENHEITSAVKVWKGAAELGVEGAEEDEQYVERIRINEKKEEEASRLRKQQKQGIP
jgi:hypothetical protein